MEAKCVDFMILKTYFRISHKVLGYMLFSLLFSHQLYLYDSTMIAPFPLLFFGGEISVFVEEGYETVAVDDFIKFKSPTRIANLVKVGIIWAN